MTDDGNIVTCTHCGRKYRVPAGRTIDAATFVCPACRKAPQAAKAEPPATPTPVKPRGGAGEVILSPCPVCGRGDVAREKPGPDSHTFLCNQCESILEESIFGFEYKQIDRHFAQEQVRFQGKTQTLPVLKEVSQQKAAIARAAVQAEEEEAAESEAQPQAPAATEPESPAAEARQEDLYWMIDHEAMSRREREKQQTKKKGVTVDDLLKEIGQERPPEGDAGGAAKK